MSDEYDVFREQPTAYYDDGVRFGTGGEMIDEIKRLRSRLDEAREILRPFAEIIPSSLYAEDGSDNEEYVTILREKHGNPPEFTGADLARARAFLGKVEE